MKVILKILLSVALLGVVVGVSYLKTPVPEKSDSSVNTEKSPELISVATTPDSAKGQDEVTAKPRSETSVPASSAKSSEPQANEAKKKSPASDLSPSGAPKILSLSSEPSTAAMDSVELGAADSSKAKPKESTANSDAKVREEQIVLYFKQKLNSLPDDLSSYEKKVAIKEVRDETCDLFHISRVKLNQLARVYKITYP